MIINYKTKTDINGNTYNLIIDYTKKEFKQNTGYISYEDLTIISTRKTIRELKTILLKAVSYTHLTLPTKA